MTDSTAPAAGEPPGLTRRLVVIADDYGIGPATSRGILDLAADGLVTGAVLLVNSPFAAEGGRVWRQAGRPMELGWHPCLTIDAPVLPAREVPSLVGAGGRFHTLGRLMGRLATRRVNAAEVRAEFRAQLDRFRELVGGPPAVVNSHHHVQVFPPVGRVLRKVLADCSPRPYVRRVREPWRSLAKVPGARAKRAFLSSLGRFDARGLEASGFPGNDWLAGVTDPPCVADERFLERWLAAMPGAVVELTCHPGDFDDTLLGRGASPTDGQQMRRVHEKARLSHSSFRAACERAGFRRMRPSELSAVNRRAA